MLFNPNDLCYEMMRIYSRNKTEDNKLIIMNEGGSRAGKTWDALHFIISFCDQNKYLKVPLEIYICRDTLTNCKDYTLKDFQGVLAICGLTNEILMTNPQKPDFKAWGNNIHFRGLAEEINMEGYPSDILFFNEILENKKSQVEGLIMRCRKLIIADWNPKFTKHWVFEMEKQPDTYFTLTTFRNNKYLEQSIIKGIEAYEPTPENILNGTADEFRYKVYNLGIRSGSDLTVFKKWELFNEWPEAYEFRAYGLDFGFVAPTALTEVRINGKNLHVKELIYKPGLLNDKLFEECKKFTDKNFYIVADSEDLKSISELRKWGLPVVEAKKGPDSVRFGVNKLLQYNLFLYVDSINLQNEVRNYVRTTDKEGNVIDVFVKKKDHLIDSIRYPIVTFKV